MTVATLFTKGQIGLFCSPTARPLGYSIPLQKDVSAVLKENHGAIKHYYFKIFYLLLVDTYPHPNTKVSEFINSLFQVKFKNLNLPGEKQKEVVDAHLSAKSFSKHVPRLRNYMIQYLSSAAYGIYAQ